MEDLKSILISHLTRLMRLEDRDAAEEYDRVLAEYSQRNILHSSATIDAMVKLESVKCSRIISRFIASADEVIKLVSTEITDEDRYAIQSEIVETFDVYLKVSVRRRFEIVFTTLFDADDKDARHHDTLNASNMQYREDCLELLALSIKSHNLSIDPETGVNPDSLFGLLGEAGFSETTRLLRKAQTSIQDDSRGSIGSSKSAVEALLKVTLRNAKIMYDADDDVPSLWKKCKEYFYLKGLLKKTDGTGEHYDRIVGLVSGLIGSVAQARNELSDHHGEEGKPDDPMLAELIFSTACTMCQFFLRLARKADNK